jgi:single-strand DNA-binding protein
VGRGAAVTSGPQQERRSKVVNKVVLIGNLGRDPELFYTRSGAGVTRLSVATTEVWTKDGERQRRTEWHRVVVWGPRAERVTEQLHTGTPVYVEGRLRTRTFTNGDNARQVCTEVDAQRLMRLATRTRRELTTLPTAGEGTQPTDEVPF